MNDKSKLTSHQQTQAVITYNSLVTEVPISHRLIESNQSTSRWKEEASGNGDGASKKDILAQRVAVHPC